MDAPFDRGEIDRASLEATERLRARLSSPPAATVPARRGGVFAWALAAALFVFAAGLLANPWFETAIRSRLPFAPPAAPLLAAPGPSPALESRLAQLEKRLAESPADTATRVPVERLARTEAKIETSTDQIARESDRIDRLSSQVAGVMARLDADGARTEAATAAAFSAANRAESLLTLLLVRRAIETGRPLGALDPALRRGFESRYPGAVKAITALGAAPVTPAALRRDFNSLRVVIGVPTTPEQTQSWWDILTTTLSSAISKPAGNAGSRPSDRAADAIARGDMIGAANELRRLPTPRAAAVSLWLDSVERWRAGVQGLATLETAALLGSPQPLAIPAAAPATTR